MFVTLLCYVNENTLQCCMWRDDHDGVSIHTYNAENPLTERIVRETDILIAKRPQCERRDEKERMY